MVAIDINGGIVERYEYDAYGSVNTYNADYSQQYTASQINNPYAFTGRKLDVLDGGGLERMYYRHRDYSMAMGRFMQQDPLGVMPNRHMGNDRFAPIGQYADGVNVYEYVKSKPAWHLDFLGLYCCQSSCMDRFRSQGKAAQICMTCCIGHGDQSYRKENIDACLALGLVASKIDDTIPSENPKDWVDKVVDFWNKVKGWVADH